jgi:parallel beta-helix repeat protein
LAKIFVMAVGTLSSSAAATSVPPGSISVDTVWNLSGSPYLVSCGQVAVDSGVTLTIAAGVTVVLGPGCGSGASGLSISGALIANGTATQKIVFTASSPVLGAWGSIGFNQGSSGSISNAVIQYGNYAVSDASGNASVSVTASVITQNYIGVYVSGAATNPTISGNSISKNTGFGVYIEGGAAPKIVSNNIDGGTAVGVYVYGSVGNTSITSRRAAWVRRFRYHRISGAL